MLYRNEKRTNTLKSTFDLKTDNSLNETVNEGNKTGTADVQELYKVNASNNKLVGTKSMGNTIPVRSDGIEVWCNWKKMEWSATDEKYTDGKTLFLETASWTYEEIMKLFKDLPKNIDYFDKHFWNERMQNIKNEN